MKWFWAILLATLALLAAPLLFVGQGEAPREAAAIGMPWEVTLPGPGQSKVLGLVLGGGPAAPASTLAEARRGFAMTPDIAIVAPTPDQLSLEAYFDGIQIGPLSARIVLTLEASADALAAMRDRAAKTDHMNTGIRRYRLAEPDLQAAEKLPVRGIVLIPSGSLDADVVIQRFGTPEQRVRQGETLEHLLYPALGLDVVIDAKGKEVLQYVAPRDFARLVAPLQP